MEVLLGLLIGLVFALLLFRPAKEVKKNDRDNAFSEKHFHKEMVSKFREEAPEEIQEIKTKVTRGSQEYADTLLNQIQQQIPVQAYPKNVTTIDLYELRQQVERYGLLNSEGRYIKVTPDNYNHVKTMIELKKMRR